MIDINEFTICAMVNEFSNEHIHRPRQAERSKMCLRNRICVLPIQYEVYANGCNFTTEGFVSIVFRFYLPGLSIVEMTVLIAVIDGEGNQRFLQSFHYPYSDLEGEKVIDNYISRSVLLNDPSALLPNDSLTLRMDFVFKNVYPEFHFYSEANDDFTSFRIERGPDKHSYYLLLDSPFAKQLRKESPYFDRISATPMMEGISSWMKIPTFQQYVAFKMIQEIFSYSPALYHIKPKDYFVLYETAHMYDIESIMDFCRRSMQLLCVSLYHVQDISSLAERYQDPLLKKIVEPFLRQQSGDVQTRATDATTVFNLHSINKEETTDSYDFYK